MHNASKKERLCTEFYGHLMSTPGAFPNKFTSNIDFTDEAVVQCDVPDVKILF